ncbi:MAG: hypothetical protein AAB373_06715 [Patescibacteria group bacterium]
MQKTIKTLFLLTIITGTFLTGCGPTIKDSAVNEEEASGVVIEEEMDAEDDEDEMDDEDDEDEMDDEDDAKDDKDEIEKVDVTPVKQQPSAAETKPGVKTEVKEEVKQEVKEEVTTKYKNGVYNSTGSYSSPAGQESITVSVTIENDMVKAMTVGALASNETSRLFQEKFQGGVGTMVIGKSIDGIGGYAQVNGSSLTPKGFDNALANIRASAKNS